MKGLNHVSSWAVNANGLLSMEIGLGEGESDSRMEMPWLLVALRDSDDRHEHNNLYARQVNLSLSLPQHNNRSV